MNKLIILISFVVCFVAASEDIDENDLQFGGYTKTTYNPMIEEHVYNLAVAKIFSISDNSQINATPLLEAFYRKIVSGVMNKLIIAFGANTYSIEIWS